MVMKWLAVTLLALTSVTTALTQELVSVDDTDLSITYQGPGAWTAASQVGWHQGTCTSSSAQNATVTWTFRGTQVEIWGVAGYFARTVNDPDLVARVALDDDIGGEILASDLPRDAMQLYRRDNLDPFVSHTITVTLYRGLFSLDHFSFSPVDMAKLNRREIMILLGINGGGICVAAIVGISLIFYSLGKRRGREELKGRPVAPPAWSDNAAAHQGAYE